MEFIFFPDTQPFDPDKSEAKDEVGDVGKEIKDLYRHRSDLYLRVKSFLKTLKKVTDIAPYLQNKQIFKFPQKYDGLYEMRIPKQEKVAFLEFTFVFRRPICKH